jgi:hypothetical protein
MHIKLKILLVLRFELMYYKNKNVFFKARLKHPTLYNLRVIYSRVKFELVTSYAKLKDILKVHVYKIFLYTTTTSKD